MRRGSDQLPYPVVIPSANRCQSGPDTSSGGAPRVRPRVAAVVQETAEDSVMLGAIVMRRTGTVSITADRTPDATRTVWRHRPR